MPRLQHPRGGPSLASREAACRRVRLPPRRPRAVMPGSRRQAVSRRRGRAWRRYSPRPAAACARVMAAWHAEHSDTSQASSCTPRPRTWCTSVAGAPQDRQRYPSRARMRARVAGHPRGIARPQLAGWSGHGLVPVQPGRVHATLGRVGTYPRRGTLASSTGTDCAPRWSRCQFARATARPKSPPPAAPL